MYEKLAGMTGTAVTEAEEFHKIYKLDVVVMPTNRDMVREDDDDFVYRTLKGKFNAVLDEVEEMHETGRPVLVGTVAIETSEYLSEMLKRRGVEHQVLNAKFHEKEAAIVAEAGRKGAVTIATNMAGRGTDIILGGTAGRTAIRRNGRQSTRQSSLPAGCTSSAPSATSRAVSTTSSAAAAGRQGDPGSTRFYVSFEDDLMRRFAPDWLAGCLPSLAWTKTCPSSRAW